MVGWDSGATLAERFRAHAGGARHLYGCAMRGMAEDWEAGGPVREVCAGYEDAPSGAALQLRLLAGVFRLVLAGEAPELVPYYPCLGGDRPPAEAWPVLQRVVGAHVAELREALSITPQTNEVGRSAALLVGLFDLVAATGVQHVRLLELGASAGLNLLLDRFGFAGEGWRWGSPASPLQLPGAVEGRLQTEELLVVDRAGCDLSPVDPTSEEGRRLLTSFVWPFDLHRHTRLAAALEVAAAGPARVDRAGAAAWLPGQLADAPTGPAGSEVLTVVWHSVTRLYWPPEEVAAVEATLAEAGGRGLLGRVSMEYDPDGAEDDGSADGTAGTPAPARPGRPVVRTELWRRGAPTRRRRLGTAHDHGVPVRLG